MCYNEGKCIIKNNKPNCECKQNYEGSHCENRIKTEEEKQMNTLIDSFLQETFEESTNDIIDLDLNNPDTIIIVQNLTNFFSEPTLVSTVPKSTQRKIIHSVDMMIMRMIDGEVPVHNNIMKLIDLSLSLNLSILKNKKILKLRNIFEESDDKEEIDNVIKL